jgi:carbamoyl-phosphate synthase large subunit
VSRKRPLRVAVTGLNATDNPAPGVGVIRALRHHPGFDGQIVGLAYDALDSGIYAPDLADNVFLMPYPSQGLDAYEARLRYVHEKVGIDVLLPTLDSELPGIIALEPKLRALGIKTFLPTQQQLDLRSKVRLTSLRESAGLRVPETAVISDASQLATVHERVPYPFYVKGVYYGAQLARGLDEALAAFHKVVAQWGLPVVVQQRIDGEEYDVVAVGDGEGGLVGAVPMKKTLLTDKGKGWAGVAVRDPELLEVTRAFMHATKWRGPCEIEAIRDRDGHYQLLEVNPRFPAWVYMSATAGENLPYAAMQLAAGEVLDPLGPYRAGTMFVRISLDQYASIDTFAALADKGELLREQPIPRPSGDARSEGAVR